MRMSPHDKILSTKRLAVDTHKSALHTNVVILTCSVALLGLSSDNSATPPPLGEVLFPTVFNMSFFSMLNVSFDDKDCIGADEFEAATCFCRKEKGIVRWSQLGDRHHGTSTTKRSASSALALASIAEPDSVNPGNSTCSQQRHSD